MKYIVPVPITDAALVSSTAPESEYGEWSASAVYPPGQLVARTATHSVYKFAGTAAASSATPPENDEANWTRVGPTNRWACLDQTVGSASKVTATGPTAATDPVSMTYVLKPGRVRGLALLDMDAEGVSVSMTVGTESVFDATFDPLGDTEDVDNWYDYYYSAIVRRRMVVLTDLPPFHEAEITVTLTSTGSVSLGTLVVGDVYSMGDVLGGVSLGELSFDRLERDEFGILDIADRDSAKKMTLPILLPTSAIDTAALRLRRFRSKPIVWIGSPNHDSMTAYGICRDWSVLVPGPNVSTLSLEIEGLV
jgi:hypothetical protein